MYMNVYKIILNIDEETFDRLMRKGFLRSTAKRDIRIYEYYLQELNNGNSKMQAMTNAADKFCTSEETIQRAVYKCINN